MGFTILIIMLLINVASYAVMWFDKTQAIKHKNRISENTLILMACGMGAIGIYLAMIGPPYHKTNKWKFKVLIPLLFIFNLFCVYFFYLKFN